MAAITQSNFTFNGDNIPITTANKKNEANIKYGTIGFNISAFSSKVAIRKMIGTITNGER